MQRALLGGGRCGRPSLFPEPSTVEKAFKGAIRDAAAEPFDQLTARVKGHQVAEAMVEDVEAGLTKSNSWTWMLPVPLTPRHALTMREGSHDFMAAAPGFAL